MDVDEIRTIHAMLHLIFHRNKNQHGKSKWWRWFSMLKRSAFNILLALEHKQRNGQNENFIKKYERYLEKHLIPRCYLYVQPKTLSFNRFVPTTPLLNSYLFSTPTDFSPSAFSTVVADGQFSTLGIVLLAVLSRFARLIGIQVEASDYSFEGGDATALPKVATANSEDLGEVVRRTSDSQVPAVQSNLHEYSNPRIKIAEISKRKKHKFEDQVPGVTALHEETESSKRRRKANAIDDIFNAVL